MKGERKRGRERERRRKSFHITILATRHVTHSRDWKRRWDLRGDERWRVIKKRNSEGRDKNATTALY